MSAVVESKGTPTHYCQLPGIWRRWREGLHVGAVVRCEECDTRWEWTWDPMFGHEWKRTNLGSTP